MKGREILDNFTIKSDMYCITAQPSWYKANYTKKYIYKDNYGEKVVRCFSVKKVDLVGGFIFDGEDVFPVCWTWEGWCSCIPSNALKDIFHTEEEAFNAMDEILWEELQAVEVKEEVKDEEFNF